METLKFDQVYCKNVEVVAKYVKVKVYPHIECTDEIVNDIFMKVYLNLNKFDSEKSALRTWIFTITNNTLIDYFRSIKQKKTINYLDYKHHTDALYNLNSEDCTDDNIIYTETAYIEDINIVHVMESIDKLDTTMKKVAELRFYKQYKYIDIAKELNIPINTVKTYISRAKEILKRAVLV